MFTSSLVLDYTYEVSTPPNTRLPPERRVIVEDCIKIPAETIQILSHGPNFVFRPQLSDSMVRDVGVAVERMAFGKRWSEHIRSSKQQTKTPDDQVPANNKDDQVPVTSAAQPVPDDSTAQPVPDDSAAQQLTPNHCLDDDLKLRRLRKSSKQPPLLKKEEENKILRFKEDITNLYQQEQKQNRNRGDNNLKLSRHQQQLLCDLKADDDIVVKPSDKSKGFVVMSKTSYVKKCHKLLESQDSYDKLEINADRLDENTKAFLKDTNPEKLPPALERAVTPQHSRIPQFYGLPKDHKTGLPVRPVVSCCDGPTSNLSLLMERILNQLLPFVPAHLSSTTQCIQDLKHYRIKLQKEHILVSLDVVGLYSNIPIADAIDAATQLLSQHQASVDMLDLTVEDVHKTLVYILTNNVFEFGSQQYRQLKGIAMGNHLAPPLAIIFMASLEGKALATSDHQPCLYRRYIDDVIMLWSHGSEALVSFVKHFNQQHPFIRFTVATSNNATHSIDYLDLTINISPDCLLEWQLFIKPSHSGVHLSFLSAVPLCTKRAVATNQFRRASANASSSSGRKAGISKIKELLTANDYPKSEVQRAFESASTSNATAVSWKKKDQVVLKLPFINDVLSTKVSHRVHQFSPDVRLVFTSGQSLKQRLVRSSYGTRICPRDEHKEKGSGRRGRPMICRACDAGMKSGECIVKNVVYCMSCTECGELYVGETERPVRIRFAEHYRDARNKAPRSPWGSHYRAEHPGVLVSLFFLFYFINILGFPKGRGLSLAGFQPFHKAKILGREASLPSRRFLEATFIRQLQPAVNSDEGWRLSA